MPKADQVVFKALQTYSDGEVVRWIDEPKADGSEAEHPAPTLKLAKSTGDDAHGDAAATAGAAAPDDTSSNGAGTGLGIAGVVLGLVGLIAGLLAYRKAATRA